MIVDTSSINGQNEISNGGEITDIEISILNGIDVLMIDLETSIGKTPVESIKYVSKALTQAERLIDSQKGFLKIKKYTNLENQFEILGMIIANIINE